MLDQAGLPVQIVRRTSAEVGQEEGKFLAPKRHPGRHDLAAMLRVLARPLQWLHPHDEQDLRELTEECSLVLGGMSAVGGIPFSENRHDVWLMVRLVAGLGVPAAQQPLTPLAGATDRQAATRAPRRASGWLSVSSRRRAPSARTFSAAPRERSRR